MDWKWKWALSRLSRFDGNGYRCQVSSSLNPETLELEAHGAAIEMTVRRPMEIGNGDEPVLDSMGTEAGAMAMSRSNPNPST